MADLSFERAAAIKGPGTFFAKENTRYRERVNEQMLKSKLKRPSTTVVVSQDPVPGDQVPLGTQVTLTLAFKDELPLDSLGAIKVVVDKWGTAGALQDAVEESDDAEALKAIVAKDIDYDDLSGGDKAVVDRFLVEQLGDVPADALGKAFADVGFVVEL